MEQWTKSIWKAFDYWLGGPEGYKEDSSADIKFYQFVARVAVEAKGAWGTDRVKELIISRIKKLHPGNWDEVSIEKMATQRSSKGAAVVDFLSRVKDQDALANILEGLS
ncbi:MAG: hypothetical protein HN909_00835 [Phycisphaerales bacterium]|jgi:hypothetical protein|nr:hypothetical protein [Phycisphaerales bacterium]MBT7170295.1 hypothetical protein [Phycisphaerales bacterium]